MDYLLSWKLTVQTMATGNVLWTLTLLKANINPPTHIGRELTIHTLHICYVEEPHILSLFTRDCEHWEFNLQVSRGQEIERNKGKGREEKTEERRGDGRGGEWREERGGKTNAQLIAMITGLPDDFPTNHTSLFSLPFVVPAHSEFELALYDQ